MNRNTDQTQIKALTLEGLTTQAGPADSLLIDIGTTTIALALVCQKTASLVATASFANPQRSFGADVISRVQAQLQGHGEELTQLLRTGLLDHTRALCKQAGISPSSLKDTYIAGNTCMIHSLLGYDMTPLSASPFRLKEENPEDFDWEDGDFHTRVKILPWLSTFIGGDITAGLLACDLETHQNALFLDLGTNGEMVLKKGEDYYMCSTAAGPAFEGNGLTCGLPAIPGAISKVRLRPLGAQTET
ncbi:MAG: ASKHA domain-containing protein, partial [Eubacterium sp.]|nr:ASKHA domain-containing protein [Eubacterium sp.]